MSISSRHADEAMALQEAEAGRAELEQTLAPHNPTKVEIDDLNNPTKVEIDDLNNPTKVEIDDLIDKRAKAIAALMAFQQGDYSGGSEEFTLSRAVFEQPAAALLLQRALRD